ncbi:MAG: hypothetical protein DLM62_13725 [Pseudonocardiales bacterium]|nr:MAG: hypothetical protein DLM62_13725 [Pseudonocardiales bacterium]
MPTIFTAILGSWRAKITPTGATGHDSAAKLGISLPRRFAKRFVRPLEGATELGRLLRRRQRPRVRSLNDHYRPSSQPVAWPVDTHCVAVLLGVAVGAGGVLLTTSALGSPSPPVTQHPVAPPGAAPIRAVQSALPVGPATFAQLTPGPMGLSFSVLTPEGSPAGCG